MSVTESKSPNRRRFLVTAVSGAGLALASSSWAGRFLRERVREVGRDVPPAPHKPEPGSWSDNAITLAWLGHASVLINFYGVRILTDPTLFPRIGVDMYLGTLGPLRLVHCALTATELPDVDLVLVSHAHFDHLDIPSLAAVRGTPAAVMAAETSDLLPARSYSSVNELRWNETLKVTTRRGDVLVRSIEVKHWGARLRTDTHRGYTGFIIEREGRKLLVGGDTANTHVFRAHARYGPFEAAIMPIGAYDPWIRNHCTPEQAVALARETGARLFVPVHHQSFKLSNEPFNEPLERAEAALKDEADRLALRDIGETLIIRS